MTHYSNIKYDLSKIRAYFKRNLPGGKNVHVDLSKPYYRSKLTDEEKIKSYVLKTVDDTKKSFKKGQFF